MEKIYWVNAEDVSYPFEVTEELIDEAEGKGNVCSVDYLINMLNDDEINTKEVYFFKAP